ncbi:unnamed protein product [Cuscuta europaea]|uniref:Uncharacterized protein n=1 Tax=Cuscuta europaea TaxID=41803 RepID=A0A9P0YTW5_CUSEU|nr:unnamed protein product [Cuscuta europaea]
MDVKRRLPEWMHCLPASDHGKKSETRDFSNGENGEEVEIKRKSKMKEVNDGQVKKKRRIKDASSCGSAEKRLKKKSKTKHVKSGENIDAKAVVKENTSDNCRSEMEIKLRVKQTGEKQHKRARDDMNDLRSRRKINLEDNSCDFDPKKHFGVQKHIDEAQTPPAKIIRTKAKSSAIEIIDKNESLPEIEDKEYGFEDEDLTVDDLLTIAKEIVNEEGKAEQKGKYGLTGTEEKREALPPLPKITPNLPQTMLELILGPLYKSVQ